MKEKRGLSNVKVPCQQQTLSKMMTLLFQSFGKQDKVEWIYFSIMHNCFQKAHKYTLTKSLKYGTVAKLGDRTQWLRENTQHSRFGGLSYASLGAVLKYCDGKKIDGCELRRGGEENRDKIEQRGGNGGRTLIISSTEEFFSRVD